MTFALFTMVLLLVAQATPPPSPSPAAKAGVTDPCGSIISIVSRPTVATSVCTVRSYHVLVENGYTNTVTTGPAGGVTVAYPQSVVRIGTMVPHLEIAIAPPSGNRSSVGGATVEGTSDVNFGLKYEAGYTAKALWGFNAQVSAATGSTAFTSGGTQYTLNANWGYTLNAVFGLAGTFGYNWLTAFDGSGRVERFSSFAPSFVVTAALPASSQFFFEDAYFTHAGLGLGEKNLVDTGIVHDFGPNVQFDAEYGFAPTPLNGQRQHYAGAGLAIMF